MEPKKNPKADLKQWSGVYFLAGLAFMLFLSWQAVEWKSYDRDLSLDTLNVGDDLDEDIPITELLTPPPPPPPPPPAPEVIEVIEDEADIEETIIESTEISQEEEIVEIEDHPWFVVVQYHPEYKSTVANPHPLFVSLVAAALTYCKAK